MTVGAVVAVAVIVAVAVGTTVGSAAGVSSTCGAQAVITSNVATIKRFNKRRVSILRSLIQKSSQTPHRLRTGAGLLMCSVNIHAGSSHETESNVNFGN